MKLEVGMYVRTKCKGIVKIDEIIDNGVITYEDDLGREWEEETGRKVIRYIGKDGWNSGLDEKEILKASYNIIDILEEDDYVNGKKIIKVIPEDICGDETLDNQHIFSLDGEIFENEIKSIVTKEQFEQMSYKIGDDK